MVKKFQKLKKGRKLLGGEGEVLGFRQIEKTASDWPERRIT